MKYRNDYRKNVIICGFDEIEKKSIDITDTKDIFFEKTTKYQKCPHVLYLDTLEEAIKHKGLILFLKVKDDIDLIKFDKEYRKRLDYWYIRIYNEKFEERKLKYSNIEMISEKLMFAEYMPEDFIYDIDNYYKKNKQYKFQQKRLHLLNEIHKYMKLKKELSSIKISEKFDITIRNVERYLNDINTIYNDIGYDYKKNMWYICKY